MRLIVFIVLKRCHRLFYKLGLNSTADDVQKFEEASWVDNFLSMVDSGSCMTWGEEEVLIFDTSSHVNGKLQLLNVQLIMRILIQKRKFGKHISWDMSLSLYSFCCEFSLIILKLIPAKGGFHCSIFCRYVDSNMVKM